MTDSPELRSRHLRPLFEQIRLLAHDAFPQRLALKPSDRRVAIHRARRTGVLGVDL